MNVTNKSKPPHQPISEKIRLIAIERCNEEGRSSFDLPSLSRFNKKGLTYKDKNKPFKISTHKIPT